MFRSLVNRLQGRKKALEEKLDRKEMLLRLDEFPKQEDVRLKGIIHLDLKVDGHLRGTTAVEFLEDYLRQINIYLSGIHEVFSGEREEKHYFTLNTGYRPKGETGTLELSYKSPTL